MGRWMVGWGGPYQFGFGLVGMLFNILIFALVVVFVVRLIRSNGVDGFFCHHKVEKNAEDIVRDRYAKGEITREQFQEMIKVLRS